MKTKRILGGFLIAASLAGSPYLLPATFSLQKTVFLAAPPAVVYAHLNNLATWGKWSVWSSNADPTLSNFYRGPVSGIGSECAWKSERSGDGKVIITRAEPGKSIGFTFYPENEALVAENEFVLEPVEKGTRLTLKSTGQLPGYFNRLKGLVFKRKLARDYENSLIGLSNLFNPEEKKVALRK